MSITVNTDFVVTTYIARKAIESANRPVRALGLGSFAVVSFDATKIYITKWTMDASQNPVGECDCEAGKPTHEGQQERYCCHRHRTLPIYLDQLQANLERIRQQV